MTDPHKEYIITEEHLDSIADDRTSDARKREILEHVRSRPYSAENVLGELPKLSSTELMLIAHDEYKMRVERKHLYVEEDWISGWINGFMTSRKWVNEKIQKLRRFPG